MRRFGFVLAVAALTSMGFVQEPLAIAAPGQPDTSLPIFAPRAERSSVNVPGNEDVNDQQETLGSEPIGEAQERWSPVGLVVALLLGGLDIGFNVGPTGRVGCENPRAENPEACKIVTTGGATVLAILAAIFL